MREFALVPSPADLQLSFKILNLVKLLGGACVGPEMIECAPREMAKLHHPLMFKTSVYMLKPVGWRGSVTMPLRKQPSPSLSGHYRDSALEDPAPKRVGSFMRKPLMLACEVLCMDTHLGSGLNEGSTEAAHLYLRAQLDLGETPNGTAVVLFVDVATAFAAMVRCLLI